MPTDNRGDKWACEACVRGHRATKCEHFDRWMVRVKKPGRPLRDCPHVNGPCTCMDDKVIMMRVPRRQQRGGCTCRVVRTFDPNLDDYNNPQSRQPPRPQSSLGSTLMTPYPSTPYQAFAQHIETVSTSVRTANGQDVGAELSHGHPLQDTMRPQQPASEASSSDRATPAAALTTLTQGSQLPQQMQSQSVAQTALPTQSVSPDINSYSSNLQLPPAQLQFPPYSSDQPAMNGIHGQHTPDISTFTNPPNTSYGLDPADLLTMGQSSTLGPLGYQYPGPDDSFPIIRAAEPSAETNASSYSGNCLCGPACNCTYCATHPYNEATRERVQDLDRIMADDDYLSATFYPQPQSRYVPAPTNGTSTEPAMAQELLPLDQESFPPALSEWTNVPFQSSAFEPGLDENTSGDNGDHSNGFSPLMQNSAYLTMAYPVTSNGTDATGTCLYGSDCIGLGCPTHQRHTGLLN